MQTIKFAALASVLLTLSACALSERDAGIEPSMIAQAEAFRAARQSGDLAGARAMLAADPRVWYDAKEGEGIPWKLGKGRWKQWDAHFNSSSSPGPWHAEGDSVWRINDEWNEYYDLIERTDRSRYRITYYFQDDAAGARKISGYMISAADPEASEPDADAPRADRFDEIETWASANHPAEWEYLRPGGKLDPTGDRPERTRALINGWRRSVGLSPVE